MNPQTVDCTTGGYPPETGGTLSCACVTGDSVPLLKGWREEGRGKHGPHQPSLAERLDTPTGSWHTRDSGRGLLKRVFGGRGNAVGSSPPPGRGRVNGGQWGPVSRGLGHRL